MYNLLQLRLYSFYCSNFSNKNGGVANASKSSGLSSSSSGDLDESALENSSPTLHSRRWVSLDDLGNEVDDDEDSSNVFVESEDSPDACLKDATAHDKRSADKSSVRNGARSSVKHTSCSGKHQFFSIIYSYFINFYSKNHAFAYKPKKLN